MRKLPILCLPMIFALLSLNLHAQQNYTGNSVMRCDGTDEKGPSPDFLYSCNGKSHFCRAFLVIRTTPSCNSVSAVSNLTSSDPLEVARINNVSTSEILPINKEVIFPVNCSCSGQYYQANTSYVIPTDDDTYFIIANNTYQGLTTCNSLLRENPYDEYSLHSDLKLRVPLRCACPSSDQVKAGVQFLLTYLVIWKDTVPNISQRFNVSTVSVAKANGFPEEDPVLFPFTTIVIPLPAQPLSSQTRIYYPSLSPSSFIHDTTKRQSSYRQLFIGIGSGVFLAVLFFILIVIVFHVRRKNPNQDAFEVRNEKGKSKLSKKVLERISAGVDQDFKLFTLDELEAATENFSSLMRLSDSVYRGVVRGKMSAIKEMGTDVSKEVKILTKINHFNLIRLYGLCMHQNMCYLVYEYMENGSLRQWLQEEENLVLRSWHHRIRIALDVANGLDYIHNFTAPSYVHKDINSGNILLNGDFRAKIANFSLARSVEREENGYSSVHYGQTAEGYMPPEYLEAREVTPKVDVFAFGVVLLELITGKEAVFQQNGVEVFLFETVLETMRASHSESEIQDLIDPRLQVKHPLGFIIDQSELASRLLKLSMSCLAQEPSSRPSMAEVVSTIMKIQLDIPEHYSV